MKAYVHLKNSLWTFTATLPLSSSLSATEIRNHVGDSPVAVPTASSQRDSTDASSGKGTTTAVQTKAREGEARPETREGAAGG